MSYKPLEWLPQDSDGIEVVIYTAEKEPYILFHKNEWPLSEASDYIAEVTKLVHNWERFSVRQVWNNGKRARTLCGMVRSNT